MACGCQSTSGNGPLLSGTLDPTFASSGGGDGVATEDVFGSQTSLSPKTKFWEAVAIVAFVVAASWVVYRSGKKKE